MMTKTLVPAACCTEGVSAFAPPPSGAAKASAKAANPMPIHLAVTGDHPPSACADHTAWYGRVKCPVLSNCASGPPPQHPLRRWRRTWFLDGRLFARPLLASTLRSPVKHTLCYCSAPGHRSTRVMAAAFVSAALADDGRAAAWIGAALARNLPLRQSRAEHRHAPLVRPPPAGAFFMTVTVLPARGLAYA